MAKGSFRPQFRQKRGHVSVIVRDTYQKQDGGWELARQQVLWRDGFRCRGEGCGLSVKGQSDRAVHHIIPLERGGRTIASNLITLCGNCHENRHPGNKHMKKRR